MQTNEIRALLPAAEQLHFDDIVEQRVLGASKHIAMIGRMFTAVAEAGRAGGRSGAEMAQDIQAVAEYFQATRGQASRAVYNAIDCMRKGWDMQKKSGEEAAAIVKETVESFETESKANIDILTDYAAALAEDMGSLLVFDYSSTVDRFLAKLAGRGRQKTVYIPESRIINGGYAFVQTVLDAGGRVHFIPDAAILYYLKQCDAAFFGAETFYSDGTAFNTIGSDIVGQVCRDFGVPLYVLTPLIKLDLRPVKGYVRPPYLNDTAGRMESAGFTPAQREQVEFRCPELIGVPAEQITAYITEEGLLPPTALYGVSMKYAASIGQRV